MARITARRRKVSATKGVDVRFAPIVLVLAAVLVAAVLAGSAVGRAIDARMAEIDRAVCAVEYAPEGCGR